MTVTATRRRPSAISPLFEALFLSDRILVLSQRPARIMADITVPLGRPCSDESTTEPAFVDIKRRCLALLRESH